MQDLYFWLQQLQTAPPLMPAAPPGQSAEGPALQHWQFLLGGGPALWHRNSHFTIFRKSHFLILFVIAVDRQKKKKKKHTNLQEKNLLHRKKKKKKRKKKKAHPCHKNNIQVNNCWNEADAPSWSCHARVWCRLCSFQELSYRLQL